MKIERPFDVLNDCKGKEVTVELKNSQVYSGKLISFDVHLNLVLSQVTQTQDNSSINSMVIRGDAIVTIKLNN